MSRRDAVESGTNGGRTDRSVVVSATCALGTNRRIVAGFASVVRPAKCLLVASVRIVTAIRSVVGRDPRRCERVLGANRRTVAGVGSVVGAEPPAVDSIV